MLIESTGISEPVPIAQTFSFVDEENGIDLSQFSYIDTMVTVVDCFNFMKDFGSSELRHKFPDFAQFRVHGPDQLHG